MENSLQIVTTDSALKLKTALPALLTEIKSNGARSLAESAVESIAFSLDAITKDPVLSKFPFDQVPFTEIVYRVIRSGTVLERAALARHLTPKAACFFPSVNQYVQGSFENLQSVIDLVLKPMFKITADHFGVNFNGDLDSVAYSIVQEFGGLSIVDFLIFFERVKTGKYRQEFQHIASRGINADFLFSWLEAYVEEKTVEVDEMYQRFKIPSGEIDATAARKIGEIRRAIDQKAKEREDLIVRARNMRTGFESSLYESVVVVQAFKLQEEDVVKVGKQGEIFDDLGRPFRVRVKKEVICDEDDPNVSRTDVLPFRVLKEGSIERLLKREIFEFITFGKSKETEEFFEAFKNQTWEKYRKEENVVDLVRIEFKHALEQKRILKRTLDVRQVIESTLEKKGKRGTPSQVAAYVTDTLKGFEDSYFEEYLPFCFRTECPPMTKDEYFLSVLLEYLVSTGEPNPFKTIFLV